MGKSEFVKTADHFKGLIDKQDQSTLMLWAADCAERVLCCFEDQSPGDERPRKAIEAGRAWARGELKAGKARKAALAAHAAAREADDESACAAARAAGHTAATAHVRDHAAGAAAYAVKAAGPDAADEIKWQFQHLLELCNNCKQ
jgi:hypothetical protein